MSIKVTTRVWEYSNQSGSALLALLALADYADDHGVCYPGLERIAHKARVDERQARRILRNLEAKGEIFTLPQSGQSGGRGHTNLYLVASGMSADEMQKVLTERFEFETEGATQIANSLIEKRGSGKKGDIYTPLKGGHLHPPLPKKGGHPGPKRGTSRAEKGGTQTPRIRHENPSLNPSLKRESAPPAILAYREVTNLFPVEAMQPEIIKAVGQEIPAITRWREVVTAWIGCGWNPRNIAGMLEHFRENRIPSTSEKRKNGAHLRSPQTVEQSAARPGPAGSPLTGKYSDPLQGPDWDPWADDSVGGVSDV